jgi:Arc/MetJ-type ribon-helix-helix transcriptional regulator
MRFKLPPDPEQLVNKRLAGGRYANAEEVFRRALEVQDAEESWTDEERQALASHIEEGFAQAERGELADGAQARREIQVVEDNWLHERSSKR